MRILVTGATGFIGGYILSYLNDKFPEAVLKGTGRNKERADILRKDGFEIITGDISDPKFVARELAGFTHIIHCAARSTVWGKYKEFYRDNVLSTRYLIKEIASLKSFIYISTANIYFNLRDRFDVREDDKLSDRRVSYYPLTKLMAEKEVLNHSNGVHTISLRPRGVIGPGDTTTMPRVMKAYLEDKIKIVGDGNNRIDFTSVKNLAHAVVLSLKAAPATSGNAYNITDGTVHQFWPLLDEIMAKLGHKREIGKLSYRIVYPYACLSEMIARIRGGAEPSVTRYAAALMKVSFTLNIDKARQELGYKPVISTGQCIDEFLVWARENPEWLKN